MDGRDRDTAGRNDGRPPRLRSSSTSQGRKGPTSGFGRFDDDLELSDDPPSWQDRFGSARQRDAEPDRPPERRPRREVRETPPADVYRSRSARPIGDDLVDERSSQVVADPYDRLRRVTERRNRPMVDDTPEPEPLFDEPPVRRERVDRRPRAAGSAPPMRSARPALPQPQLRAVGSMLARSSQGAGALAKLTSAALVSLLALGLLTVLRLGSASDWLIIRLDAAGEPTLWGTNEALLRVPLLIIFATVAGLLVAWRLRRYDAFAAQFTIVAVLLLHGFGWVAAGRLLF